jgi:CheY-like chemotaxis protein
MADAARKKLVLVVDDDDAVRTLVARALALKGYDVIEAADGLKASEALGGKPLPDLVICDVMMPTIDGFTFVRLMKSRPELRSVPVIFLTAKGTPRDVAAGISAGAKHYVHKPFKLEDLLDKVARTVR